MARRRGQVADGAVGEGESGHRSARTQADQRGSLLPPRLPDGTAQNHLLPLTVPNDRPGRGTGIAASAGHAPRPDRVLRMAWTCALPGSFAFWNSTLTSWATVGRGAHDPLLVHVGHQRRLPGRAGHRLGADVRVAGPGDHRGRSGVLRAVGRAALQPRLYRRLAVAAGQGRATDDVVDGPGRYLEAVNRVVPGCTG